MGDLPRGMCHRGCPTRSVVGRWRPRNPNTKKTRSSDAAGQVESTSRGNKCAREDAFQTKKQNCEGKIQHRIAPLPKTPSNLVIVSALAVIGDVEAFALAIFGRTQSYDHVDELVEYERSDTAP